jgi:hypothetical protein
MGISNDPRRQEFGRRFLDALILPNRRTNERYRWRDAPEDVRNGKALNGKRAILVQASDGRLGMYVMGQALFSRHLMEKWFRSREVEPKSLRSVIVCTDGDLLLDLEPLLKRYDLELFVAKRRSKPAE